jgi:hypothetical protein
MGRIAQEIGGATIRIFSQLSFFADQRIGNRVIDAVVTYGNKVAQIEMKYSLPDRAGSSLARLAGQAQAMVQSGRGQAVVWSLRMPSPAQLELVRREIGAAAYGQVKFLNGVSELHEWLIAYFCL